MLAFNNSISEAYKKLDLYRSKIIYIYSDLRYFMSKEIMMQLTKNKNSLSDALVKPLLNEGCTVVIPTFTYTTSGIFDVIKTPTYLGSLNKYVLNHQQSYRSNHPIFSYAAIGQNAKPLLENIGKSAFGYQSLFERLSNFNSCFLHIGRRASEGNTLCHYIEQLNGCPYRYNKIFDTKVFRDGKYLGSNYSAFMRMRNQPDSHYYSKFVRAAKVLYANSLVRYFELDHPKVMFESYTFNQAYRILSNKYNEDNKLFLEDNPKLPFLDL